MARFADSEENYSLEEQIKSLGDDELLDFWEETQHLAKLLTSSDEQPDQAMHPEYERLILQELQVRSSRGELR